MSSHATDLSVYAKSSSSSSASVSKQKQRLSDLRKTDPLSASFPAEENHKSLLAALKPRFKNLGGKIAAHRSLELVNIA